MAYGGVKQMNESGKEIFYSDIKKLSIVNVFGKKNLENIQNKISKATGLAFVTVDYKGTPVTEPTSFTAFCQSVRKNKAAEKICMSSDAFGAVQSAVTRRPFVYFCPCGLLEIAIPIIINEQYLGGFIGGQLNCEDAPEPTARLSAILRHEKKYADDGNMKNQFNSIPIIKYQQFIDYAELIFMIINQLEEKEIIKFSRETNSRDDKQKLIELENKLKNAELKALREKINPYFLIKCLNTICSLAIIEDAQKTNEISVLASDFFKDSFLFQESIVPLSKEMKNIEKYLIIQRIRLGDNFNYSFEINDGLGRTRIPCLTVLPFIEEAILSGAGEINSSIKISASLNDEYITIEIISRGAVTNNENFSEFLKIQNEFSEEELAKIGIENSKRRMALYYGENFKAERININSFETKTVIKYPNILLKEVD
jgi:ligand-binding sensor protein